MHRPRHSGAATPAGSGRAHSLHGARVTDLPAEPSAPSPAASKSPNSELQLAARADAAPAGTLGEQREQLFSSMLAAQVYDAAALSKVRAIFAASPILGQGNPQLTKHPMSRTECAEVRAAAGGGISGSPRCGAKHMVTVYESGASESDAHLCVDQFEFPNLPCEYPVVHATAREALKLCEAVGKRLCDAHEWEGACAGALRPVDDEYAWGKPRPLMTWLHNHAREMVWAYGSEKDLGRCATGSRKEPGCTGGYNACSSNTYPAGSFPGCVSPFGVYDQHGNVAEHMNLPLTPDQQTRLGSSGATEMKGSWFIFSALEAHPDDCRWRAKDWHPSRVDAVSSHGNYHLGFRCCKSI